MPSILGKPERDSQWSVDFQPCECPEDAIDLRMVDGARLSAMITESISRSAPFVLSIPTLTITLLGFVERHGMSRPRLAARNVR
jgi:hypothetical protein